MDVDSHDHFRGGIAQKIHRHIIQHSAIDQAIWTKINRGEKPGDSGCCHNAFQEVPFGENDFAAGDLVHGVYNHGNPGFLDFHLRRYQIPQILADIHAR